MVPTPTKSIYEMSADDRTDPVFVCTPLRVSASFADAKGMGWGKVVSVRATGGSWHDVPVLNADLVRRPADVIATLMDRGLQLAADKKSRERALTLLKSWQPDEHLQSARCSGWVDDRHDAFILGEELIGRSDVLPLVPSASMAKGLAVRSDHAAWRRQVGLLCRGNPLMVLAASLAFSGPLLAPLGQTGGGLHFRGASSSGKTTLLKLAASVWGGRQMITQWRATANGLEAIAATLNDMLLPLDEIAEIDARDLHKAVYMLANGTGKARMTKDAVLADPARWRLALISSGEISVEEKLKEARATAQAGQEVRLIDVEADSRTYGAFDMLHGARDPATFAEDIQRATTLHHGATGQAFVRKLMEIQGVDGWDVVDMKARRLVSDWLARLPAAPDGQVTRVARRFALTGTAGNMATRFGLTGWGVHEASNSAEQAFLDWHDRRYGIRHDTAAEYVAAMQSYLTANLGTLPKVESLPVVGTEPVGWVDATHVYLLPSTWSTIYPAAEGSKAAKALLDMQMLLAGEEGRLMRKAPRSIPGRPRLYTLTIASMMAYRKA